MNSLRVDESNPQSMADERPKRFADVMSDDEIGYIILFCRFIVDDHQFRAAVFGHHRKASGGPDHQRRTDRNKQITALG